MYCAKVAIGTSYSLASLYANGSAYSQSYVFAAWIARVTHAGDVGAFCFPPREFDLSSPPDTFGSPTERNIATYSAQRRQRELRVHRAKQSTTLLQQWGQRRSENDGSVGGTWERREGQQWLFSPSTLTTPLPPTSGARTLPHSRR